MQVHTNSIRTYYEEKPKLNKRAKEIYEFFCDNRGIFTDRQVQELMRFAERNMVQPRISELIKGGYLQEMGKTKCHVTNKLVRVVGKA